MSEKRPLPDAQSGGSQPAPKKSRFDKPAGNAAPTAAGIPAAEAAPASNAASVLARAKTALLNKGNLQAKLENLKKLKSKLQAKPLAAAVATNAVMKAQKPTVASGLAAPAPVTLPAPAALPATGSGVRQAALQKAAQLQTSLGIRPAGMPAAGPLAAAAAASAAATSMTEPGPATVLTQAAAAAEQPGPAKAEAGMEEEEKVDAFFDPRMAPRTQTGERRRGAGLDFHRPGRLQREAERERFKKAFGKDWKEQLAHKRRMERKAARMKEDANLVPIGERKKTAEAEEAQEEEELRKQEEQELEEMPEVEWWDALLLDRTDDYPVADDGGGDGHGRLLRSVLEAAALLPSMDGATTDGAAMEVDGADANGIAAPREPMGWVSAEVRTELEAAVQALAKPKLWKALELEEHPVLIEPPLDAEEAMPQALKLTKKELKKMRKQRREAREKEKQDMIRQGMLEAPKAKVRISNMMRVLRTETVADPTAMEQEVRRQMTERQAAHDDRNLARSLTPAERKAKKMRKLFDGPVPGGEEEEEEGGEGAAPAQAVVVSLYRLGDLKHKLNRIKVHMNATENHMTGRALWVDAGEAAGTGTGSQQPFSLVVVEGGNKATKRYAKLMLRRIDWAADYEGKDHQAMPNQCCLVWQGEVKDAAFKEFKVEKLATSTAAKKLLVDAGVGEYWDLAKNFDPVTAGPEVV